MIADLEEPLLLLSGEEHLNLVHKINQLPFGDADTRIYKRSLEELYEKYQQQVKKLAETCASYKEIAELVRKKEPLTNTRKYVRVRRISAERKTCA